MEAIPRKYGEWGQFDRYCKLVLYHEAIDYLREMKCRRDREVSLDALSPADWDKLSTVDRYSCDSKRSPANTVNGASLTATASWFCTMRR